MNFETFFKFDFMTRLIQKRLLENRTRQKIISFMPSNAIPDPCYGPMGGKVQEAKIAENLPTKC